MTIDANIIIAYLAGDNFVVTRLSEWRREGKSLFLSAVAETEVLSFSDWTLQERRSTERFLEENFTPVPFDRTLAKIAGVIRAQTKIKFPDAAIAATALYTHTPIVTRNQRDFKKIAELTVLVI